MPTLHEICQIIEASGDASSESPLQHACALPRSAADLTPLPEAHSEIAFDSSWDVLLAEVPAPTTGNVNATSTR